MMPIPYKPTTLTGLLILALAMTLSGCIKTPTDPGTDPPPNNDPNILSIPSASGAPGDTGIMVNVNLHNVEAIGGLVLRITYDSTVLTPSDTRFLAAIRSSGLEQNFNSFGTPGLITFLMYSSSDPLGKIDIGDGPILHLLFDVKPSAQSGTSTISFNDNPNTPLQDNQLSDTLGMKVIFPQLQNSSFTVQ